MSNSISERLQVVQASFVEAEEKLKSLQGELASVDAELEELSGEREQFHLLEGICSSIEKLDEMGAAYLFWGEEKPTSAQEQQLQHAMDTLSRFQEKIGAVEERKQAAQAGITEQEARIANLQDDIEELQEQEERAKYDYVVEREERDLPYRPMLMPWTKQGEDESRYRKALALVFLFIMTLSGLIQFWELPAPDEDKEIEVPEHLVKLVKKQKPKPKPKPKPKQKEEKKKDQKKSDSKKQPKPTPKETKQARKVAESSGVLAFKDNFSDLLEDDVDANLGASAKLSNKGAKAKGDSSRNLVMSQAKDSSGGINTASLSKNVGGGAGKKIGSGVSFERVESAIGTDMMADDRPLSDGQGPSRTDQEIQIVFDRYKAAIYRIYQRELRKDPTLRGQMVFDITIKPDGTVSAVKVVSDDLGSSALSSKVVGRIKRFNFGPKEGVPTVTIRYPIDFLPAG